MSRAAYDRLEDLPPLLRQLGGGRVLLVADCVAYESSGAKARLEPLLADFDVRRFHDFEPNPQLEHVDRGRAALGDDHNRAVLALGGGTAIDLAKLVCSAAAGHAATDPLQVDVLLNSSEARRNPLIAVPTTAGTGSEATQFAVVYVDQTKHSVSHPSLLPDAVVLDASLTYSLPQSVTAATGLDALSQAVESLWSVQSTETSRELADEALRLAWGNLEAAVNRPAPDSRAAMLRAAHLAGQAINISRTTAAHALSYAMTIRHGVPHGLAVALSMPPLMRFNGRVDATDVADPRGVGHVERMVAKIATAIGVAPRGANGMDAAADAWEQMVEQLGCPTRLSAVGIQLPAEREHLALAVNLQRLANNPRHASTADLLEMIASIA